MGRPQHWIRKFKFFQIFGRIPVSIPKCKTHQKHLEKRARDIQLPTKKMCEIDEEKGMLALLTIRTIKS
jgi:hypothetical protein